MPTVGGARGQMPAGERSESVFVVLAFSGGGMRSAAFSYGLLKALKDTNVRVGGRDRRLLDEIDVISSVSGGSYTAAYYGLFGEQIFEDYEAKFLRRDVEGELKALVANPLALASLASPNMNRSDVAASWLGDQIFSNKTMMDMRRPDAPAVIINASDINTGTTFSFIQQQFDFLCSSIDDFPVARAVMASSAVPGYFAPVAIRNYAGDCPGRNASWVAAALREENVETRNFHVARALARYADAGSMPAIRLLDGGITDNLGVRGSMISPVMHYGKVEQMSGAFDEHALDAVSKVLVIIANAQAYEDYEWSRTGREPGLVESLSASFDSAIGILNSETVGLARRGFEEWADETNRRPSRAGKLPVEVSFVTLTFDQVRDEAERARYNSIPMSLTLPDRHVDEMEALSGRLLRQSREFQKFLTNLD